MAITFDCPGCLRQYSFAQGSAGQRYRCSECGTPFRVPGGNETPQGHPPANARTPPHSPHGMPAVAPNPQPPPPPVAGASPQQARNRSPGYGAPPPPPVPPPAPPQAPPPVPAADATVLVSKMPTGEAGQSIPASIPLTPLLLIGRDAGRVHLPLPHASVSRLHAQIKVYNNQAILWDLHSANGTFVNGRRLVRSVTLRPGDRIDIGPYSLTFSGDALLPQSRANNIELVSRELRRVVRNPNTGKPLALLENITLAIRPREFVCLLGPSGSGKSTLLSALSGRVPADEGAVLLNDKDLYANFDALKQDIALVPQKDVLHDSLRVEEALWYTAKLRLPPDTGREEIHSTISKMLDTVSLTAQRRLPIHRLSGGQLKRASLANELLCQPSLLFLDEVTSGLDEQTDREMMALFRNLAHDGKTVVCVTHSLANVEKSCHLVVILAPGGRLAFFGSPAEALKYFQIDRLGDVYERLKQGKPEEWQAAYQSHPLYERYITSRVPASNLETASPPSSTTLGKSPVQGMVDQTREFIRQSTLMLRRYFAIKRGDRRALMMMAGQSLLVALLLMIVFGNLQKSTEDTEDGDQKETIKEVKRISPKRADPRARMEEQRRKLAEEQKRKMEELKRQRIAQEKKNQKKIEEVDRTVKLLFLLQISCFWFGCNNAAKEIVKERILYMRERDFNLQVLSYYVSKVVLLTIVSGLQTAVLLGCVFYWCDPAVDIIPVAIVLFLLATTGVALGLAISAGAQTEEVATALVPIVLIPQIILAGMIVLLSDAGELLAQIGVTAYWGNQALLNLLSSRLKDVVDEFPQLDIANPTRSLWLSVGMIVFHLLVFMVGSVIVMVFRDRKERGRPGILLWRKRARGK